MDAEDDEASEGELISRAPTQDIPFASPRLLWRMKVNTHREKDAPDLLSFGSTMRLRFWGASGLSRRLDDELDDGFQGAGLLGGG